VFGSIKLKFPNRKEGEKSPGKAKGFHYFGFLQHAIFSGSQLNQLMHLQNSAGFQISFSGHLNTEKTIDVKNTLYKKCTILADLCHMIFQLKNEAEGGRVKRAVGYEE